MGAEASEEGVIARVKRETQVDEPELADAWPGENFPGQITLGLLE